jgi:hypothetical protein
VGQRRATAPELAGVVELPVMDRSLGGNLRKVEARLPADVQGAVSVCHGDGLEVCCNDGN